MSEELKEFIEEQNPQLSAGIVGPSADVENIESAISAAKKEAQQLREALLREKNQQLVTELRKLSFSIEMFLRQFEQQTGRAVKEIEIYRTSASLEDYYWSINKATEPGLANRIDWVQIRLEKEEEN